jgi:hypothetical protein
VRSPQGLSRVTVASDSTNTYKRLVHDVHGPPASVAASLPIARWTAGCNFGVRGWWLPGKAPCGCVVNPRPEGGRPRRR